MPGLFAGTALEQPVTCERCRQPLAECQCPKSADGKVCTAADQPARVRREKRRGQWVTVAYQLDPAATDLKAMLKKLKATCAAGGTTTPDGFELQGDHRDRVIKSLKTQGYPAKPSGG